MTITEIKQSISDTSVTEVIKAALLRAEQSPNHAVLEVIKDRALERATLIDEQIKQGEKVGVLAGVPFVAKDNMLTYGGHTTAASRLLENFEAPFQAEAIERLEAAGAICIAKANLDAFAHGGSTENSAFGPTTNPHDESKVAGGSSGGSAASVALEIAPFALGTDTGGSIRQPASFCGVVGFKPTYGAVSRYGVVAMASSTDVVGPLATTVDDITTVMDVIAGRDLKDSTTVDIKSSSPTQAPKKVGVVKEWLQDGVERDVLDAVKSAIDGLVSKGYEVEEVSMPALTHSLAVYYILVPAEIASNLARYDGVRYGVRPEGVNDLQDMFTMTRSNGFMPENKRRILMGNYVLSSGYYDAYFTKAAKVRTLIVNEFAKVFETYDLLIGPVAPATAFALGQKQHDPLSMYLADQMTVSASLAGLPSVSVPIQTTGLPVGLQIIGKRMDDAKVLALASELDGDNA